MFTILASCLKSIMGYHLSITENSSWLTKIKRRQAEKIEVYIFYTLLFMYRKVMKIIFEKGKASDEGGGFRGCLSVVQNIFRGGGEEGNS